MALLYFIISLLFCFVIFIGALLYASTRYPLSIVSKDIFEDPNETPFRESETRP